MRHGTLEVVWSLLWRGRAAPRRLALVCLGAGCLALAACGVRAPAQGGASGVSWDERLEVAAGGGHRGPWRMNESRYEYVDDPTVAISEGGAVAVAWADQSRKDIVLQIYEADGRRRFDQPSEVSRSPRVFSWLPRVLFGSADGGEVYVLWQEIVFSGGSHGGEIFFARSTDGGRTFSQPRNLSDTTAGAGKGRLTRSRWHNGSLDLAAGAPGQLFAAWTEYEGALWLSRSTDGGATFSEPVRVAGDEARPARGPSLAVGAAGEVHLAWTVGQDEAADIRVATSTDGGQTFGPPRIAAETGGHSDAPKLAVDSAGVLHLVYAESPGGPLERYHIAHSRSRDRGRTFEPPRAIAGAPAGGPAGDSAGASFPMLQAGADGALHVTWERFPRPGARPRGLGFTHSSDGGDTFAAPSLVPGSADPRGFNGSQQGLLMSKLAVNRSGRIALVNSTFAPNQASHVWLILGRTVGREAR